MLTVTDLACARGGQVVLDRVSFSVAAGTALVLRGPNGVGKTTLLRTLAGLQPVSAGSYDYPPDQSAYASHADGVKSTLTVAENLDFWADVYRQPLTDQVYTAFNLTALRDRMAGSLSAGQKRRVGLARLAVINRKLLFLDEPTVSLDAASVLLFRAFLEQHLATGGAAVLATHIELGLAAPVLELGQFQAVPRAEEAFL